jgi:hypothetical protein
VAYGDELDLEDLDVGVLWGRGLCILILKPFWRLTGLKLLKNQLPATKTGPRWIKSVAGVCRDAC